MDVVATLAAIVGSSVVLYLNWATIFPPTPHVPREAISLDGAALKGTSSAPMVLIEYSDYRCTFCAKAEREILPQVIEQYVDSGRVQFALRQHPLERLHPGATRAATAVLCAGQQGKFWQMHSALFRAQDNTSDEGLLTLGRELALNEGKFRACLDGDVISQVRRDTAEAERLGLGGTPAFVVGRRQPDGRIKAIAVIDGAQPLDAFAKAFQEASAPQWRYWIQSLALASAAALGFATWFGLHRRRQSKPQAAS